MPFEELECETRENAKKLAKLSYMPSRRKGKTGDGPRKPMLIVTLPTVHFISKASRFKIFVGSGSETGVLRIMAVPEGSPGGVKPHEFRTHVILRFGHVPKLGEDMWDSVACDVTRMDDDTYDMTPPPSCLPAPAVSKPSPVRRAG